MPALKPQMAAPELEVESLSAGRKWTLSGQRPDAFTMVVFYRGLHCPICTEYVAQLDQRLGEFTSRGVEVLAVSGDGETRARRSQEEWGLDRLTVGYGLPLDSMREWGLFVSEGIKDEEPQQFNEPGLFLVRPDGTLYLGIINSMPFGRPQFDDIRDGLDFVAENDYPARGEA
jgi:peroxiredoxin